MRALQLYALAAAFTRKNVDIWKKVAMLAIQIGEWGQGLVAICRVVKADPHPEWIERKVSTYIISIFEIYNICVTVVICIFCNRLQ